MGQPLPNTVDGDQIRRVLLPAFEQAMADTNAASQAVDAVSSSVPWHGRAAEQYRNALQGWREGLTTVQNGLNDLSTSMATHFNISDNAEAESASHAKWYAPK
jgi:uncharacterized protein YukE